MIRNKVMSVYADALIVFIDPGSKGSRMMLEIALNTGMPTLAFFLTKKFGEGPLKDHVIHHEFNTFNIRRINNVVNTPSTQTPLPLGA